jgi:hypothetical protein
MRSRRVVSRQNSDTRLAVLLKLNGRRPDSMLVAERCASKKMLLPANGMSWESSAIVRSGHA